MDLKNLPEIWGLVEKEIHACYKRLILGNIIFGSNREKEPTLSFTMNKSKVCFIVDYNKTNVDINFDASAQINNMDKIIFIRLLLMRHLFPIIRLK